LKRPVIDRAFRVSGREKTAASRIFPAVGLLITFAVALIASVAGISAVLAGGGTTQLVVALAIHIVGTIVALGAVMAALDAG
jgi:hypothetical protein